MADIIGIDLGTTKSAVAIWRNDGPEIIPNADGDPITPSVVALDPASAQWVVGRGALEISIENPHAAIYSIKRFMGRRFMEDVVQESLQRSHILYEVMESRERQGGIEVVLGKVHLTPQEVSAKILQKLKADAEAALGGEVTQAVITVPAYFNDLQRQATRDAGLIAGLDVTRVLNEPTAACLAFGYKNLNIERRPMAVYDLGGGTFDISILEVGRGPFWVRATNGNTHLGGNDLDWLIVDWILEHVDGKERQQLREDVIALARLRAAAEWAKRELSAGETQQTYVQLTGRLSPTSEVHDLDIVLTRDQLQALAQPWIDETLAPCVRALHDAHLSPSDIKEVLLVGGQTRMPGIRQAVREFFGLEPNVSANPEEVVALGAAVQAAILAGQATGLKLADVVPLSLGVRTRGGKLDVLVPRNARVPTQPEIRHYTTFYDNQDSVEVRIFQGERPMADDNVLLGNFILEGIELARAQVPDIEVTFQVDESGILHVTGKDVQSGKSKRTVITESTRLSDDEIEAMIQTALEHSREDTERRRQADLYEQSEDLVRRLRRQLAEKEASLSSDLVAEIHKVLAAPPPTDWATQVNSLEQLLKRMN